MVDAIDEALAAESVGAVESVTVTVIDAGDPVIAVCALPAVSVAENEVARVSVEVTAAPPNVAVEVAVIVQTLADVCAIPVIAEMPVYVKSSPLVVESVEQLIESPPAAVTVKVIVADPLVAAEAARVRVGAVVSKT